MLAVEPMVLQVDEAMATGGDVLVVAGAEKVASFVVAATEALRRPARIKLGAR